MARDWGAIGQNVRQRALEAVGMHFAMAGVLEVATKDLVARDTPRGPEDYGIA